MRVLNVVVVVSALSWLAPVSASASSLVQIGTSPAQPVVARAPRAVSVTFNGQPAASSELRIWGPGGEVSAAQPQVVGHAIRRSLDPSVPKGRYTVTWTTQNSDGTRIRGSFAFTAASGTGSYAAAAPSTPASVPATSTASAPATSTASTPASAPATSASTSPASAPATSPMSVPASSPAPSPPSVTLPPAAQPQPVQHAPQGQLPDHAGSLSARLMLVPLALVLLLVLASVTVGMISSARRHSAAGHPSFVHRGPSLPWQRHQT